MLRVPLITICFSYILLFSSIVTAEKTITPPLKIIRIKIAINQITYDKYPQYIGKNLCSNLPNFTSEEIDRALLELSIICLAFKNQNVLLEVDATPSPSYLRSIWMVKSGLTDTAANSVWTQDIEDSNNIFSTIDIIRPGEFEKGIYVHESHPLLKVATEEINLSNYVGLTVKSWVHDWQLTNSLTNKKVLDVYLPKLFKMLATHRGDFTLMEFPSTPSLSVEHNEITLKPISGVKVLIPEARKFIFSKKNINAKEIFTILNKGLRDMRTNGKISELFTKVGLFNQKTKHWRILNNK